MELKSILEALIFVSGRVLGTSDMMEALKSVPDGPQPSRQELEDALQVLIKEWEEREGGIRLIYVAEGYEFRSRSDLAPWIKALNMSKPQRLSMPAIETLSMIAYRQPITRAEIESVRGVDSGGVLRSLIEYRLVKIVGRKEEAGRPLLYATTKDFLELFGLADLSDLPPLSELEERIKQQVADKAAMLEPLAVDDLLMTTEELSSLEEDDRNALQELDHSLQDLKQVEKQILESAKEPENPDETTH